MVLLKNLTMAVALERQMDWVLILDTKSVDPKFSFEPRN